jgi:hypothetical protein
VVRTSIIGNIGCGWGAVGRSNEKRNQDGTKSDGALKRARWHVCLYFFDHTGGRNSSRGKREEKLRLEPKRKKSPAKSTKWLIFRCLELVSYLQGQPTQAKEYDRISEYKYTSLQT